MSSSNNPSLTVTRNELKQMLNGIIAARVQIADGIGENMRLSDLVSRLRLKISNLRTAIKQLNRAHIILKREHQILQSHYQNQIIEYGKLYRENISLHNRLALERSNMQALIEMQQELPPEAPTEIVEVEPMRATFVPEESYEMIERQGGNGQA